MYDDLYCAVVNMCKYGLTIMYFVYASSFYTLLSSLILADMQRGTLKEYDVLERIQFEYRIVYIFYSLYYSMQQ